MSSSAASTSSGGRGRSLGVWLVIGVAVALIGLVNGIEDTQHSLSRPPQRVAPSRAAPEARSYADMRVRTVHPNADVVPAWWASIHTVPDLMAPVERGPEDRDAALAARAPRRAYDGAPPTIPHAVDQLAVPACETCHDRGAKVAGMTAPAMSHEPRGSCLQCHVVATDPRPGANAPPAPETTFVGWRSPPGQRAWPGAPPTMPHSSQMRERCASCHGPRGSLGIRSTHPWRVSCEQCHAPSATLDQRPRQPLGVSP